MLSRLCLEVVVHRIDQSDDQEIQFDDDQTDICPHLPPNQNLQVVGNHQTIKPNQGLQVVGKATAGGFCVSPACNWQPGCRLNTRKRNRTAGKCYPLVAEMSERHFQAKWHARKFKQVERTDHGGFRDIFLCHRHLIVSPYQIHFRKHGSSGKASRKILCMWNSITISFGNRVKTTVVAAGSASACRFLRNVKQRCPRTGRSSNNSHVQHLIEFIAGNC